MKYILIAVGAIIAIVILFFIWQTFLRPSLPFFGQKGEVTINDKAFTVEVVDTDEDRQKGLSGRRSLPADNGMLFLFDTPDFYSFWMKEMEFPIDIIFINGEKIVTIHRDVPAPASTEETPPIYRPTTPADKVLELNAGEANKYGIKEGDSVTLQL